jgi:lactoylglutathione lyase
MPRHAFPVIYAHDVGRSVRFYEALGFETHYRLPPEGEPGYVGLRRGDSFLGVVTAQSPKDLIGVEVGTQPRFELFVYVDDVDRQVRELRQAGAAVLREPEDIPWGERLAYVADPEGNPVTLAFRSDQA